MTTFEYRRIIAHNLIFARGEGERQRQRQRILGSFDSFVGKPRSRICTSYASPTRRSIDGGRDYFVHCPSRSLNIKSADLPRENKKKKKRGNPPEPNPVLSRAPVRIPVFRNASRSKSRSPVSQMLNGSFAISKAERSRRGDKEERNGGRFASLRERARNVNRRSIRIVNVFPLENRNK